MRATLVLMAFLLGSAARGGEISSHDRETLVRLGVPPTGAGALAYLRDLVRAHAANEEVRDVIAELGHNDFDRREAAMHTLLASPVLPLAELEAAARSGDPEIRWRVKTVLDSTDDARSAGLISVFRALAADPAPGAAAVLVDASPLCRKEYIADAAYAALRKNVRPADLPKLQTAYDDADSPLRTAAAVGLVELQASRADFDSAPFLNDRSEVIALASAARLADAGRRETLPALVRLLESDDLAIRSRAYVVLRAFTARASVYAAYDDAEKRAAAVADWRTWLREESAAAELHFPLQLSNGARGHLNGNMLIATGGQGRVSELDPAGKEVWSFSISSWSAEKLPTGEVLIASYDENRVVVVDREGRITWEYKSIQGIKARPLTNGNFLIADFSGRRALEVDRDKREVWSYAAPEECFDTDRLPNGNTIVACPNIVREVTPDGATVREWKVEGRLNGFQALPNGNLLIANYGLNKVYEMNMAGEMVWEFTESQPCDAYRLPDGSTLISTAARIIKIDAAKNIVKEISKAGYGSARE